MKPRGTYILTYLAMIILFFGIAYTVKNAGRHVAAQPGELVPSFQLPNLWQTGNPLTQEDFKGHVSLLNIWGSWCGACRSEHALLLDISKRYPIPIYSIAYHDDADSAKQWLNSAGNPFVKTGIDSGGAMSQRFGIYGTPELILIDKNGIIRYRFLGAINENDWENSFLPLIQKYSQAP